MGIADSLNRTTKRVQSNKAREAERLRRKEERDQKARDKEAVKRITTGWQAKAKKAAAEGQTYISIDVPNFSTYDPKRQVEEYFTKRKMWTDWRIHTWHDDDGNEFSNHSVDIGWGKKPQRHGTWY